MPSLVGSEMCIRDRMWTEEIRYQIRSLNDHARLVMMPDVSHFLMLDRPEETNRLLLEFGERVLEASPE